MKNLIKRKLATHGYELVPDWLVEDIPLRDHLRKLFAYYNVTCVIDVGANIGQYGQFLRERVNYKGEIISLEPVSESFARLRAAAQGDPNWKVHRLALGSARATMTMNIMGSSALNSFLSPDLAIFKQTGLENQIRNSQIVGTEQVEVDTLDHFLAKVDSQNIYLKMDTQGYDKQVLAGGQRCIDRIVGLQTETAMQKLYIGATGYQEMTEFVTSLGFELSGFFPVNHDVHLRLVECDTVFVKSPARK